MALSVDVIAERLGRNGSTIFRELRRNHFTDAEMPKVVGCFGVVASMKALSRCQKDRKLVRHPALRELIIERIKDGWTPEQISGRLIYEKAPVRVCQETIYCFVYSAEGMREDLCWYTCQSIVARAKVACQRSLKSIPTLGSQIALQP